MTIGGARADESCTWDMVRDRLREIKAFCKRPDVRETTAAAQKSLEANQDLEGEALLYFSVAALYHRMKRHYDVGLIDEACNILEGGETVTGSVLVR